MTRMGNTVKVMVNERHDPATITPNRYYSRERTSRQRQAILLGMLQKSDGTRVAIFATSAHVAKMKNVCREARSGSR
jgi:hypothetical protein